MRETYGAAFAGLNRAAPFPEPPDRETAFWFSGLVFDGDNPPSVNDLCDRLRELGVEARPFWKPVHFQPPYSNCPSGPLPVTEDVWRRIITLPCSTSLTPDQQAIVIGAVKKVLCRMSLHAIATGRAQSMFLEDIEDRRSELREICQRQTGAGNWRSRVDRLQHCRCAAAGLNPQHCM